MGRGLLGPRNKHTTVKLYVGLANYGAKATTPAQYV